MILKAKVCWILCQRDHADMNPAGWRLLLFGCWLLPGFDLLRERLPGLDFGDDDDSPTLLFVFGVDTTSWYEFVVVTPLMHGRR